MSAYINTKTNEYPIYAGDLAVMGVDVSDLPDYIQPVEILPEDIPAHDSEHEYFVEKQPVKTKDGKWKPVFEVLPLTEEMKLDKKLNEIRRMVAMGQFITAEEAALLIQK